jgi:hypothetical protein
MNVRTPLLGGGGVGVVGAKHGGQPPPGPPLIKEGNYGI